MSINVISLYEKDSQALTYTTGAATMEIVVPDHEEGLGLLVKNKDATTGAKVTIKAGNSIYALGDYMVTVPKSSDMLFNLKNTGRYKNVFGEKAGKIVVTISEVTPADVSLCAFEL